MRLGQISLLSVAIVLGVACIPTSAPPTANESLDVSAKAESATVEVGQTARMSATAGGSGELTYRWYQLSGRAVELLDSKSASASFVAPSVASSQTLRFRVDVRDAAGRTQSAFVEVTLAADPQFGTDPGSGGGSETDPFPRVRLRTSEGDIVLELDRDKAPISVNNFLRYVDDGFYDGTIFHRVVKRFVVQGGGFLPGLERSEPRAPIVNEASNGLKNVRSSLAMARTTEPNSATSQFYINLKDNPDLDFRAGNPGYAVFGRVVQGMDVVDRIADVQVETRDGFENVPVEDVVLERAERVTQ